MNKTGKIKPLSSDKATGGFFGIGLEKVDRYLYNPSGAYDLLGRTGVKLVRIQSGWARTEKTKGVYDFGWLDNMVDEIVSRDMEPWICLCYGNSVYTPDAKDEFGCVSFPPVKTEEERRGWTEYCIKAVERYRGKVSKFEIWNEPEWLWQGGSNAVEYGEFAMMTAKAVKEAYPDTYIIAGALTHAKSDWVKTCLETGLYKYADAVSYHIYSPYPEQQLTEMPQFFETVRSFGIRDIIQGESGAQSQNGSGALWEYEWNEERQTKVLLRNKLIDMILNVRFSSYFTSVDVREALIDVTGEAFFGILKNEYGQDENGKKTITGRYFPKPSYTAFSTVVSVFDGFGENLKPCPAEDVAVINGDDNVCGGFVRNNGAKGFCYYHIFDIMKDSFSGSCDITLKENVKAEDISIIDLADGSIYKPDNDDVSVRDNCTVLKNMPLKDYPVLIATGLFTEN